MKAVLCTEYGGPEVLSFREVECPRPGRDEILVRTRATVVSPSDCAGRSGTPRMVRLFTGLTRPSNPVLGDSMAGEVVEVGEDVKCFKTGDKVYGSTGLSMGAYAQYNVLKEEEALAPLPGNVSYGEAAAVCDGAITALPFLRDTAGIRKGQKILINGASGSVGSFAVQLAKYYGAEVTGTCGRENRDMLLSLGADHVIDYHEEEFSRNENSYDIIFDAVGKSSYSLCRKALREGGVYMTTVPDLKIMWHMMITSKKSRKRAVFSATGLRKAAEKKEDYLFLTQLMEEGALKTIIDREYSLSEMRDAHSYVEKGHKKGNVIINIED